jgi:MFS family permease
MAAVVQRTSDVPVDDPASGAEQREPGQLFRSLRYPGAKRYFAGLSLSMVGTWMQSIALSWLVVKELGGGGRELGLLMFCQFLPMLVLGAWAGALSDRLDKRRLMLVTQAAMGIAALALATLDVTDRERFPAVLGIALLAGLASAFDTPVRRALIGDLVPREALPNAMSLNTGVITSARVLGMAVGGFVTRFAGTWWCFLLNGISYLAMIVALWGLSERSEAAVSTAEGGRVRDGVRHVWSTPALRISMLATAFVATFTFNYGLTFPLMITEVFRRDADALGSMMAVTSVGSFLGAMISAKRRRPSLEVFLAACLGMGVSALACAVSPSFLLCSAASVPMGVSGGLLMSQLSGLLTTFSPSSMRGRVLALQSVVFLGSTPIGGPVIGLVSDAGGPRWGMALGGVIACAAGAAGIAAMGRSTPASSSPTSPSPSGHDGHATMQGHGRRSFPSRSRLS